MKIPVRGVAGLARVKRYGSMGVALVLSVLLAVPNGVALQPNQVSIKNLQAFTDPKNLPAVLDALEKLNAAAPRASYDVQAKAAELGRDIDKIFGFVRDQVRYEVYEGVLRGPQGTLMGGAGNSYDKSLLLAALLRQNGYDVRHVRGRLSEERAKALVSQMFAAFKQGGPAPGLASVPVNLPNAAAASKEFADVVVAYWLANIDTVRSALERDKVRPSQAPPVSDKDLINEAMDHVWVEYRQGDKWVALDPSTKGARLGESFAASQQTPGSVPPALFHRVTIRVMAEERRAGKVSATEALRHEAPAADLNGASASLSFKFSPAGVGWSAVPVLRIEDKEIAGRIVAGSGLAGGVQNLGRELFARPGQPPQSGPREPTAVWIDFDFTYPSGRVAAVRRKIFDRIGPVARGEKREADAPLLPLDQINGTPVYLGNSYAFSFASGSLHPDAVRSRFSRHLPVLRQVLPLLTKLQASGRKPTDEDAKQLSTTLGPALPDLSGLLASSFHIYSHKGLIMLQTSRKSGTVRFYEATPRLAIVSFEAALDADGKTMTGRTTLDLRRNELRVIAEGVPGPQVVGANAIRGMLDGVLEHVMIADLTPRLPGREAPVSAISVMERARDTKTSFATLTTPQGVHKVSAPDAAKARMSASVGNNVALVAPARAISLDGRERLGWWQLDLRSGETLALMDTGLHAVEFTLMEKMQIWLNKAYLDGLLLLYAVCVLFAIDAVLAGFVIGSVIGAPSPSPQPPSLPSNPPVPQHPPFTLPPGDLWCSAGERAAGVCH